MSESGGVSIDLPTTRAAYLRRHADLSWTKLQQFERCPANWLVENFAVVRERKTQRQDHRHAFPGTIIQRVWEAAVNDRVFQRPGFDDPKVLARWCADQTRALYQLIVMPVDAQWERPQSSWRTYFATPEGEERRQGVIARHGLDPVFERHLQPQFVDEADINTLHGSVEGCLAYIGSRFELTISALGEAGIMLDCIEAERYVAVPDGQFRLAGQVDFLVRTQGTDRLANGYRLIDGKFGIGPTVEIGQLYFYALLVERADGIAPGWLGFLDYGNGRLVGADGDGAYRLDRRRNLAARLAQYETAARSLADAMNTIDEDRSFIGLQEIPGIVFQPSRLACGFCSIGNWCEKSVRRDNRNT
jgi:PD-(D/E)XK nuclease superfamily